MERLDKVLSNAGYGSRKEIKDLVKKKLVSLNGEIVKDFAIKVEVEKDIIKIKDKPINYRKYIYLLMNKPNGVVSATFDNYDKTVIDLLSDEHKNFNPFPIGRLDKDTVGLLLLTNDGDLNHKLISPKSHVNKIYYAKINKPILNNDIEEFKKGITIDDGYKCMPAVLNVINNSVDEAEVHVTIQEGKFHQVKRMFKSLGKEVNYLQRIKFGPIPLDKKIPEGQYRELTKEEILLISN